MEKPIDVARALLKKREDDATCLKAGICPKDGTPLVHEWLEELIEREGKQRAVLERLCETYIANRHAMGVHDFVKCVTTSGSRCADSETGRLWLEAAALARCKGEGA